MEVILVDDDEIILTLNKFVLIKTDFHHSPKVFIKAQDCLEHVKLRKSKDHVLVFLDINMPEMNGWEFLEALQKIELKTKVLVVVVSSSIDHFDKVRAKSHPNVIDYFVKPLTKAQLNDLKSRPELIPYFSI
jgi:two-component SAPR family response regulator